MPNKQRQEQEDLRRFLDAPGVRKAHSRTVSNADKPFDDSRKYAQKRVDAVTLACVQALKKTT